MSLRVLVILAAVVGLGSDPCAMFPGGDIEEVLTPVPATWEILGEQGTQCELEVDPPSPTSVHIDCYTYGGRLYVHTHRWSRTPRLWGEAWATAARRDPNVRLGHQGRIYELYADPVVDASLREEVLHARGFDPVPEGIQLFALRSRPSD